MHIAKHDRDIQQAQLARSLVDNLGLEGAVFACRANGWDGVLAHLLNPGDDPEAFIASAAPYHM